MLKIIDISSWQADIILGNVLPNIDGCIVKATEADSYTNPYCNKWIAELEKAGKPFGFYHFAQPFSDAASQAEYFIRNCKGYFGNGIPVLDWEVPINDRWVNTFVNIVHSETGIWPWIYGNAWRFDSGTVEKNCARWIAAYPDVANPTFEQASKWEVPECDGAVAAWQFCSDGRVKGYHGDLDCSLFYGDLKAWNKYAGKTTKPKKRVTQLSNTAYSITVTDKGIGKAKQVLEDKNYKITIERK